MNTHKHPQTYNKGRPPTDWWDEIERTHGHVGPWNVLGWRIGDQALQRFDSRWGAHELDIICYVPMKTPYTCMVDGLIIATGNCPGRLDIHLASVMARDLSHVSVCRKDGAGLSLRGAGATKQSPRCSREP